MSKKHDQVGSQLGNILRALREERGLTREWVAEYADIGLRNLAAIELGEKNPSIDTLYRLLRVLGASADRIFYPERFIKDASLEHYHMSGRYLYTPAAQTAHTVDRSDNL